MVLPMRSVSAVRVANREKQLGDLKAACIYFSVPDDAEPSETYAGAMAEVFELHPAQWGEEKAMETDYKDMHSQKWDLVISHELTREEAGAKLDKYFGAVFQEREKEAAKKRSKAAAWAMHHLGSSSSLHRLAVETLYEMFISEAEKTSSNHVEVPELVWIYDAFVKRVLRGEADYFTLIGHTENARPVSAEELRRMSEKYSFKPEGENDKPVLDMEDFMQLMDDLLEVIGIPEQYLVSPLIWLRTGILCLPDGEYARMFEICGSDMESRKRLKKVGFLIDDFCALCRRLGLFQDKVKFHNFTPQIAEKVYHETTTEKRNVVPQGEVRFVRVSADAAHGMVHMRHHTHTGLQLHDLDRLLQRLWNVAQISPFTVLALAHKVEQEKGGEYSPRSPRDGSPQGASPRSIRGSTVQ